MCPAPVLARVLSVVTGCASALAVPPIPAFGVQPPPWCDDYACTEADEDEQEALETELSFITASTPDCAKIQSAADSAVGEGRVHTGATAVYGYSGMHALYHDHPDVILDLGFDNWPPMAVARALIHGILPAPVVQDEEIAVLTAAVQFVKGGLPLGRVALNAHESLSEYIEAVAGATMTVNAPAGTVAMCEGGTCALSPSYVGVVIMMSVRIEGDRATARISRTFRSGSSDRASGELLEVDLWRREGEWLVRSAKVVAVT